MIYKTITDTIKNDLISGNFFTSGQVLPTDAVINGNEPKYCRLVMSYGQLSDSGNLTTNQSTILSLQIYQKKGQTSNTYQNLSINVRNYLKNNIHIINDSTYKAQLKGIFLNRNIGNNQWNSMILNLSFNIINMG